MEFSFCSISRVVFEFDILGPVVQSVDNAIQRINPGGGGGGGGGGGTPIYELYRYVPGDRVWFLRFSVLK